MYLQDISILFISIILEAFPFILIGIIISSIIQEFMPEDFLPKIMPKNKILAVIVGLLMGLLIPVCDCAVIPVARRLLKKGIPLNVGITFMLASPIINPIVIGATLYSFSTTLPEMFIYRTGAGVFIAIVVGIIMSFITKKDEVFLKEKQTFTKKKVTCSCGCENETKNNSRFVNIVKHAKSEFFEIGKFLIIGALISSVAQVIIPRDILTSFGNSGIFSILALMIFAYIISLCSTSDSFVAKTFAGSFSNNSILAFLLLGPMIDIKNTIVLLGNYNKKFVIMLISLIFIAVFITALLFNI